jgi:polysaccharide chain length determinant protein (PEP-CTERM system associated)
MRKVIAQALVILRGASRYRWPAVAVAWLIAIAGWIGVQFIPDKFESRTQVYVDTESLLKPLLTSLAANPEVMSQVAMMQAVLLSRPNLAKVAQKTDLLLSARTPREKEAAIDSLASRIELRHPTGPGARNTFLVSFEDSDPEVAHRVVRTLLDTFMQDSLGLKRSDAGDAQRFRQSQAQVYQRSVADAEQRLAAFKQANVGLLPGSSEGYYQKLEAEMGALRSLQQRYSELSRRRDGLRHQLQGEEPTFGMTGPTERSPIDGQIAGFKAQRDQLLLQYTEKHPQVQSLNETIARLEAEKRSGARISQSVAPPAAETTGNQAQVRRLDVDPTYQNLRLSLNQADAELAELRGQIAAQQGVVTGLRGQVNAIQEVEAELTRLNRDHDLSKQQYETLRQRHEQAKLSDQAEQDTANVKFRVIEPPAIPVKPSGPKRAALDSLVLVTALGAGLGLAVFLAHLHPTFTTRDVLSKVTGIPVLGSVTTAVRAGALPWYRRQTLLVSGAVSLLLIVYLLNVFLSEPPLAALRNLLV